MIDFNGPATEVFQILRSYNYEVMLFDDDGNQVYEPEESRRFFCKPTNMLLSVIDDGDNSALRLYLSRASNIQQLRGLISTLRATAPKYNLLFNVRKYGRELSPKDFATKHSVKESRMKNTNEAIITADFGLMLMLKELAQAGIGQESAQAQQLIDKRQSGQPWSQSEHIAAQYLAGRHDNRQRGMHEEVDDKFDRMKARSPYLNRRRRSEDEARAEIEREREKQRVRGLGERHSKEGLMNIYEGMYGTTRSSYLKLENARMIVRHSSRVNEDLIGSRGRNIHAIFVENKIGERTLFPVNNLDGARAMTQHINQGGAFADPVGSAIVEAARDYTHLSSISRHIGNYGGSLNEAVFDIREACRQKMKETRRMFERMFRPGGYQAEAARINEEHNMLAETGEQPPRDFTEQITNLRGLLTVEGVEIGDNVLESAARVGVLDGISEARRKVPTGPMVNVLGIAVPQETWDRFRRGEMDLRGTPQMGTVGDQPDRQRTMGIPQFKSRTAELSHKLGAVITKLADDQLANFLSQVNDQLQQGGEGLQGEKLRRIAMKALSNAGMSLGEQFTPDSPAIREFQQWMRGQEPIVEQPMVDEAVRMGNPSTFTFESNLGGHSVTVTATSHPATAGESAGEPDTPARMSIDKITTAEGRDIDPASLGHHRHMLEQQAMHEFGQRVGDDPFTESEEVVDEALMSTPAMPVASAAPVVTIQQPEAPEASLTDPGLVGTDEPLPISDCGMGDDELSMSDIILPTNQAADLAGEITPAAVPNGSGGMGAPDQAYISRLQNLAGMR